MYQHYKGGIYSLLGFCTHTETLEKLVIYADSKGKTWVRPKEMFSEFVEHEGEYVQRFTRIESGDMNDIFYG